MKYKTGIFSSIINNRWHVETTADCLTYKKNNEDGKINYFDINNVRLENGIIWNVVNITTNTEKLHIDGLSSDDSNKLSSDLEDRIKNIITVLVIRKKSSLNNVALQIGNFLRQDRYLSHTDIRKWLSTIPAIGRELSHPYFEPDRLPLDLQETISVFVDISKPQSETLNKRNEEFVARATKKYDHIFSRLEKYPLTEEQKRAAVINEDRNLLIAAAGSGKSSTIVAKAVYLIECGLAKPNEILVLAYNKNAQLEIDERLRKLVGITPSYNKAIEAKTFHGLGMDIIINIDGIKPTISELASAGKTRLATLFQKIIMGLVSSNPTFAQQWINFLIVCKKPTPDLDKISSYREYNDYLKELGAYWKEARDGRRLVLKTIDGKEVKSMEELRISNWLVINGINYEYEKCYPHPTADASYRQYYPDFYYPDADLYHEHFAIDEHGNAPTFMRDYESGVYWKRNIHKEKNTNFIETHSAYFKDGSVFDKLKSELIKYGVRFTIKNTQELDKIIQDSFNPENDTQIVSTFLRHFKANNTSISQVREKANSLPDKTRTALFLDIFTSIHEEYQFQLKSNNEIDFEDQINKACEYLESNKFNHPYTYILVDEFQDISQDRKRMIHALLDQNDDIKLFVVGDDWQSIYRFSGADIDIMTHFSDHFGATSKNHLTHTFRSYQGIVDVASEFIQRNPNQLQKTVLSSHDTKSDQVFIREYNSSLEQFDQLDTLLEKINQTAINHKQVLSVFLLGRYNHLNPKQHINYIEKYQNLNVEFKSIHAAKGLEADYVVLLNVEAGYYGFPSTITDDPLLHMVIPRPESFPHAEERRLMYVAITRAKRAVFIFSGKTRQSSFVTEIAELKRVSASHHMKRANPCPQCNIGELKTRKGKFGTFMGCSNYPDCNYSSPLKCPDCAKGKLVTKQSRNGPFLSCSQFPKCRYHRNL